MSREQLDPGTQSALIWSKALTLLRGNETLSSRQKGWFEGVLPEAIYGTTIILAVENNETQHMMQTELNSVLLQALRTANGDVDLFPAFKIMQSSTAPSPLESSSTSAQSTATREERELSADSIDIDQALQERASSVEFAAADDEEAVYIADFSDRPSARRRGPTHVRSDDSLASLPPQSPVPPTTTRSTPSSLANVSTASSSSPEKLAAAQALHEKATQASQGKASSHYDEAVVQSFEDIMPGTNFDTPARASSEMPVMLPQRSKTPMLDPETHLTLTDTFDTFVPGDSNRFARTVALAVAEGSGRDFNPLCIYGGSGLGKTHLLNAIGNYALVKQPNARVRYVTSEEFTNEYIDSILGDKNGGESRVYEFNRKYREVDVLLIDDIQFLAGKESTLEMFFHTFNTLYQNNKRIVIASDVPPKNLKGFEARLISRFEQGLTVDVKPPDLETRIAILRMLISATSTPVPSDVVNLIAERFTDNIRELEGALNRVTALASLNNQPVTRSLAEQTLQDFFSPDIEVKPTDIISRVAKYFHLTFDDLVGPGRTKSVTMARQIAMYLTRDLTSMSLVNIGEVFGGRDHTTVMHNCKIISEGMKENPQIYTYVTELTVQLRQKISEQ